MGLRLAPSPDNTIMEIRGHLGHGVCLFRPSCRIFLETGSDPAQRHHSWCIAKQQKKKTINKNNNGHQGAPHGAQAPQWRDGFVDVNKMMSDARRQATGQQDAKQKKG